MADVILDTPIVVAPTRPAAAFRTLLHNPGVVFGAAEDHPGIAQQGAQRGRFARVRRQDGIEDRGVGHQ